MTQSFEETVCSSPLSGWGTGPSGFWVMLFIFSKLPELIDTVFIVLRKRQLIFLHWYHHVTVLLFCWHRSVPHLTSLLPPDCFSLLSRHVTS